ncbi:hypothetical protein SY85_20240 [Flavisolibacter tropicus]|uniref:Uncharacterized protein n=2 Tax=Flavisolibacter tropicus TaxID=1492898 RepID=A0A172TZD7_9BACT|nr:hypothetical protein SY85_20240 [Flavisolibacter tropicus]
MLDIAPWGGSEVLWSATAKLALLAKHEVFTSTYYWEQPPAVIRELSQLGAKTHFRKGYQPDLASRLLERIRHVIKSESREIKALKKFNPERILINQAGAYDMVRNADLMSWLLTTPKPFFICCNGYHEDEVLTEESRAILLKIFMKAKGVFVICKRQATVIMKQLAHQLSNIQLINNPVNLKEIKCQELPSFTMIQMASVASLHVHLKGQDILLEVLSAEKWKRRAWQLNLYGDGPHKTYLQELVEYFGLQGRVAFKGHVPDVNSIWQNNHLLVLCSRTESGPMALTEAMLCGRPTVATRVGKVPELLQDNQNGYVAAAATVVLLEEALERAWQNRENWSAIGKRAHDSALAMVDLHAPETYLNLLLTE